MTDLWQLRRRPPHCCIAAVGSRRFTCDTFDLHFHRLKCEPVSLESRQTFDLPIFNPVLRQHAQTLFF
jgi:hypothetical protein